LELRDQSRFYGLFFLLLLIALLLMVRHLDRQPTWFDEGLNLTAGRVLAESGVYGLESNGEIRRADPAIQSGPPFILMISLFYQIFGSDLLSIRLTIVILAILTLIALYALTLRLYGHLAAVIATIALLMLPGEFNFIDTGRQILGEIPAALCIAIAFCLLMQQSPKLPRLLLAGLCFGVAVAIKSQALLILSGSFGLWITFNLLRRKWDIAGQWLIVGVTMAAVYAVDFLWRTWMAGASLEANSLILREGVRIHILAFRTFANLTSWEVLPRLALMGSIVGLTFVAWRRHWLPCRKYPAETFLWLFVSVWVFWFAFVSIGWARYAFLGTIFAMPLLGNLAAALWRRFGWPVDKWALVALSIVGLIGAMGANPQKIIGVQDRGFLKMADYLQENVPPEASIITWEWSLRYMTNHNYILPTTDVTNAITESIFFQRPYLADTFDGNAYCPDYVLFGSFNVDQVVFASVRQAANPQPVFEAGIYQLYALPEENSAGQAGEGCVKSDVSTG
jgi:4-amino-4-deoxy-L-arabinose transferase-like glycosyltransferase